MTHAKIPYIMDPVRQLQNSKKSIMRVNQQGKITPPRKPRGTISCATCRRRKVRCDRLQPCTQCVKHGIGNTCFYPQSLNERVREAPSATGVSALNPSTPVFRRDRNHADNQQGASSPRSHSLENESVSILGSTVNSRHVVTGNGDAFAGTFPRMNNTARYPLPAEPNAFSSFSFRGKDHKTRFFGRSHWATTLDMFPDLKAHLQKYSEEKHKETHHKFDEYLTVKRLKHEMRAQRKSDPDVSRYPSVQRLEELVPSRSVADSLVDLYFSSFETTFRILHKPQFMSEYNDYWDAQQPPGSRSFRTLFLAKLLALMACSSNFQEHQTAERSENPISISARSWFEGVVSWISSTTGYARLNLDMIQIRCLMLLGAQAVAYEGDLAWMTAGSLVREAITMGLHTDPSNFPRVSCYMTEMRRRIWLTVVELDLQSALQNGTPMGVSWDEMDVTLPSNVDDEDLHVDSIDPPVSSPITTTTRTSFQLILARSLRARMTIAKSVSNIRCPLEYQAVLGLSDELTTGMANTPAALRSEGTEGTGYSTFQRSFYLFLIYRCLLALHRPFFLTLADTGNPTFEYSRRLCVQASTALLAQLESSDLDAQSFAVTNQSYPYLLRLRGGMFRDDMFHAAATLCFELCLQAKDAQIPSLPGSRSSFIDYGTSYHVETLWQSIENAVQYFEFKVRAEKQGCKALMFLHLIVTSARNLRTGKDSAIHLDDACPQASRRCRDLLLAGTANANNESSTDERPEYADAADIHASSPIDATETETIQHMPNQGQTITPLSMGDSVPEFLDPSLDWNLLLDSFDPYSTTRWPLMDPLM